MVRANALTLAELERVIIRECARIARDRKHYLRAERLAAVQLLDRLWGGPITTDDQLDEVVAQLDDEADE
jgi:hypothetical protein